MKAFLMHHDRDFDLDRPLPPQHADLTQDLELHTLWTAMASGDRFLYEVAQRAMLTSLTDPETITYRQRILRDCLAEPSVVREIYQLAVEAIQKEKRIYIGIFNKSPEMILRRSVQVLEMFLEVLRRLRRICAEHAGSFRSDGFVALFRTLADELDDAYFQTVDERLRQLRFKQGVLISAHLGKGNHGTDYVLRKPHPQGWAQRLTGRDRSALSFVLADRDEAGHRALARLRDRGVNLVANALAQSADHILSFFRMLRAELGFYIGCLNLHRALTGSGDPTCFPEPRQPGTPTLACSGLYDPCLSLTHTQRAVGNTLDADRTTLVVITGANQGGKSTFLRSIGLAQLMMQCGLFVAAESFTADTRDGIFTHFRRDEDATMTSGKLDEELRRMSGIIDTATPNALLLCNESFAATNEREGSQIAGQIIHALVEAGIKVLLVTHMYDLAHGFYTRDDPSSLFLRAGREPDGTRTFRLTAGEPLPTSHGEDLYTRIFGTPPDRNKPPGTP